MTDANKMTRKTANPKEVADALALRAAGYSALAISQRLGIPTRTLHRHFAEHGAKKGALRQEMLDAARADLLGLVTSDEAIRMEAAKLVSDDLAHARHLREVLVSASDHLQAYTLKDAVLVMRAVAAYSTAIKNTSDMLRHGLGLDRLAETDDAELPELVITELTQDQVEKLRLSQVEEAVVVALDD